MKKEFGVPATSSRRPRSSAWIAVFLLALAPISSAQLGPPPKPAIVIQGGTVHVGNGDVLDGASVILRGRRIEAVGKNLAVPEGATVIDAAGRHVYPGLIDAEANVLLDGDSWRNGEGNLVSSVVDALDPFDRRLAEQVLRGGVTSVYVATHRSLFDGAGAVIKLKPGADVSDLVVKKDAAIAVSFGLHGSRPSMRLREWKQFIEQLDATKKYVEAWDDYAEKLADYKKELEKAKKESEAKKPEAKKEGGAPAPAPEPEKKEAKPPEEPKRRGIPPDGGPPHRRRKPDGGALRKWIDELRGKIDADNDEPPEDKDEPARGLEWKDGVSYADGPPQNAPQQGGEKKDEGPKKPGRPGRDAQREVLRKVLEGKLPLRVQVNDAADAVNLLDVAQQYHFKFAITGGHETPHVAAALKERNVPVVVAQSSDVGAADLSEAAELDAAGVDVVITTNEEAPSASSYLSFAAAAAVAGGMDKEKALAAITSRAAALLGVADQIGSLEAGKDADVVVTRGEILSSAAVVERVFVDGVQVIGR